MIAKYHGLGQSPDPTKVRIVFEDEHEMTWWIEISTVIGVQDVDRMMRAMFELAADPMHAIEVGIITRDEYEEALRLRDEHRAAHPKPKETVM